MDTLTSVESLSPVLDRIKMPIILWEYNGEIFTCVYTNNISNGVQIGQHPPDKNMWMYENVNEHDCNIETKRDGYIVSITKITDSNTILESHYPSTSYLSILHSINNKVRSPLTNIV